MIGSQKDKIEQMVAQGKTIVQICSELDLEWKDVRNYLHSVDKKSWLGAKKVITNRLKKLKTATDESEREQLVEEAAKWIDYLYYDGKDLGTQVDRARKALDNAQKALDG